jgi:hypothetical protein
LTARPGRGIRQLLAGIRRSPILSVSPQPGGADGSCEEPEMSTPTQKACKGIGMQGWIADWYTTTRRKDLREFQALARRITAKLPPGSRIVEVALGAGLAGEVKACGRSRQRPACAAQSTGTFSAKAARLNCSSTVAKA